MSVFASAGGIQAVELDALGPSSLQPSRLGSLPPFVLGEKGFQNSTAKPFESAMRFNLAERTLTLKTAYAEKTLLQKPFIGEDKKRSIFGVHGASDLIGERLKGEAEFSFNTFGSPMAESWVNDIPKMFRMALKGSWRGYNYGAEYRSLDKGFVHFKGGESGRSENLSRLWGETRFGGLGLKADLSQLSEKLNESADTPRLTRSASLDLNYNKGRWGARLASRYGLREDRFRDGSRSDLLFQELRATYRPIKALKVTSLFRFSGERNRNSGVRSDNPGASLSVMYGSARKVLNFVTSMAYDWFRTSDGQTHNRKLVSTTKVIWNFGDSFYGRKTLTYEFSYAQHADRLQRNNSTNEFAAKFLLTLHSF